MATRNVKWTDSEVGFLVKNYKRLTAKECAKILNRKPSSVYQKAAGLGLSKERRYSEKEIEKIMSEYSAKGPELLAKEMNRSRVAIRDMAVRLGLSVSVERRRDIAMETRSRWTEESLRKKSESQRKYRGPLSGSWKGGVCNLSEIARGRLNSAWGKFVFRRDDYTCQICGKRGVDLVVHHVKTFAKIRDAIIAKYPHLFTERYEDLDALADLVVEAHRLRDGITLCRGCHVQHHLENGVNCGNILTGGAEDNPQPSRGNVLEFVPRKVQRLTSEDAQADKDDKSAPPRISHTRMI